MNPRVVKHMVERALRGSPTPLTHATLCLMVGVEWEVLSEVMRELRREGRVRITLDRAYEWVPETEEERMAAWEDR